MFWKGYFQCCHAPYDMWRRDLLHGAAVFLPPRPAEYGSGAAVVLRGLCMRRFAGPAAVRRRGFGIFCFTGQNTRLRSRGIVTKLSKYSKKWTFGTNFIEIAKLWSRVRIQLCGRATCGRKFPKELTHTCERVLSRRTIPPVSTPPGLLRGVAYSAPGAFPKFRSWACPSF